MPIRTGQRRAEFHRAAAPVRTAWTRWTVERPAPDAGATRHGPRPPGEHRGGDTNRPTRQTPAGPDRGPVWGSRSGLRNASPARAEAPLVRQPQPKIALNG